MTLHEAVLADVDGEMQVRVRIDLRPGVAHADVRAIMHDCGAWLEEHGRV